MDVNININVDGAGNTTVKETGIKKKTRRLKNGKEVILEMPNAVSNVEEAQKPKSILNLLDL